MVESGGGGGGDGGVFYKRASRRGDWRSRRVASGLGRLWFRKGCGGKKADSAPRDENGFRDLDGTARELASSRGPPRAYRVLSPLQVPWTMDSREQTVGGRGVGATFSGILH